MSSAGQPVDPVQALAMQGQASAAGMVPPQAIDPVQALAMGHTIAPPTQQDNGPAADPNDWRTQLRAGPMGTIMHGMGDAIYGGLQLGGKLESGIASLGGLTPNPVSRYVDKAVSDLDTTRQLDESTYQAARKATGREGFDVGRLAGNVISPVNAVAPELGLGAKIGAAVPRLASLGKALMEGGYYGAMQPVDQGKDFWKEKGLQAATGSGTAGVLHGVGSAASAVISPNISSQARLLLNEGVPLTAGQTLGGSVQRLEDSGTSIPFVGDMIKSRQRDALVGLQNAAINRSLDPVGEKLPAGLEGHAAIDYAQTTLGNKYDNLLSGMSAKRDPALVQDINGIVNKAGDYGLVGPQKAKLAAILKNQVVSKADASGVYDGAALKDVQSNLSFQARNHSKSLNPDDKNLADALIDAKSAFNDFIARHNPVEAPQLQQINEGWANFARTQQAAERAMKDGISTPAQLGMAVRTGGTRGQNATGNALMQDLSSAGQSVLPSTVPDSGTPLRHAVQLGLSLAGAGAIGEHAIPGAAPAAAGMAALGTLLAAGGTKAGQNVIRGLITKRPQNAKAIADALQQLAPTGAAGLTPLLLNPPTYAAPK